MADFLDFLSGGLGLFGTAYNMYTNKRDFDYQKAVQQETWQREDTAFQRRRADLEAAGFNPNLALSAGGAGAGSVVSRSTTNDINAGAMLDYLAASKQIKGQNIQNNILYEQKKTAQYEAEAAYLDLQDKRHRYATDYGFDNYVFTDGNTMHVNFPDSQIRTTDTRGNDLPQLNSKYQITSLAEIQQAQWIPQQQKNEMTNLIYEGQKLIYEGQRVITEQQKLQIETIWKKFQMDEQNFVDTVSAMCSVMNATTKQKEYLLKLDTLEWHKEKWAYEMIVDIMAGLTVQPDELL